MRWLFNLLTPPPKPRFKVGDTISSAHLQQPARIITMELRKVRSGVRWNEETRGWMCQLDIAHWINDEFLEPAAPIIMQTIGHCACGAASYTFWGGGVMRCGECGAELPVTP